MSEQDEKYIISCGGFESPTWVSSWISLSPPCQHMAVVKTMKIPEVSRIIFNPPATIIMWSDGSKTVVKTTADEDFDEEKGLGMAVLLKLFGSRRAYQKLLEKGAPPPTARRHRATLGRSPSNCSVRGARARHHRNPPRGHRP